MFRTTPSSEFRLALVAHEHLPDEPRARAFRFPQGTRDPDRAVVCLAGMGADGRSFARLAPLAEKHFVLPLNVPTRTPPEISPLDYAADAVEDFLDSEGLEKPVLVGSSFGGSVAALVALRQPTRLSGLVLVSAVVSRSQIPLALPRFINLMTPPDALARLFSPAVVQVMGGRSLDRGARDEIVREARLLNTRELKQRLLGLMSLDLYPRLHELSGLPTLWVHGSRDRLVPWQRGKTAARFIPGSTFSLIKNAGHLPYLTHAARFNQVLEVFLQQVQSPRKRAHPPI